MPCSVVLRVDYALSIQTSQQATTDILLKCCKPLRSQFETIQTFQVKGHRVHLSNIMFKKMIECPTAKH